MRLHLSETGDLTMYPIGLSAVVTDWTYHPSRRSERALVRGLRPEADGDRGAGGDSVDDAATFGWRRGALVDTQRPSPAVPGGTSPQVEARETIPEYSLDRDAVLPLEEER